MVIPEYLKTPSELLSVFSSGSIPDLWEVEEIEHTNFPCPFKEQNIQDANEPIGYLRAFMSSSLEECIGKEKTESFWQHVERIGGGRMEAFESKVMYTMIVLRRTSEVDTSADFSLVG